MAARIKLRKETQIKETIYTTKTEKLSSTLEKSILNTSSTSLDPVMSKESELLRLIMTKKSPRKSILETTNAWNDEGIKKQLMSREFKSQDGIIKIENVQIKPYTDTSGNEELLQTPEYCRNNSKTYQQIITCDLKFEPKKNSILKSDITSKDYTRSKISLSERNIPTTKKNFVLGYVPTMLRSNKCILSKMNEEQRVNVGECTNDYGGYFIINGGERSIISQESLRSGLFMLWKNDETGKVESRITCATDHGTTIVTMVLGSRWDTLKVGIQYVSGKHIPLYVAFAFLGFNETNATDLISHFIPEEYRNAVIMYLQSSMVRARSIGNNIVGYIIAKKKKQKINTKSITDESSEVTRIIREHLFANIKSLKSKAKSLAYMASQMILNIMGIRGLDDRDSWGIRKATVPGKMMEIKLNSIWSKVIAEMNEKMSKQLNKSRGLTSFVNSYNDSEIYDTFVKSFMVAWTVKNGKVTEAVTDSLKRDTPAAGISQVTRLNAPSSRKNKNSKLREVQQSQLGFICSAETPEGEGALTGDAQVMLYDGRVTKISELKENDAVTCIEFPGTDMDAKTTTYVTKKWSLKTDGVKRSLHEITTISGETIKSTDDHPFFTERGWVETSKLNPETDRLCMIPWNKKADNHPFFEEIFSLDQFMLTLSNMKMSTSDIITYTDKLAKMGFIPLLTSNPKLHIISRMFGYISTSGKFKNVNGETSLFVKFKSVKDAKMFIEDAALLGFARKEVKDLTIKYDGTFSILFIMLGIRIDNMLSILPKWIEQGSDLIVREFLAGLYGVESENIETNPFNSTGNKFIFQHRIHDSFIYKIQSESYLKSVRCLYASLGIKTCKIETSFDGKTCLDIGDGIPNIIKLNEIVGFRYNTRDSIISMMISNYYKHISINPKNYCTFTNFRVKCLVSANFESVYFPISKIKKVEDEIVYDIKVNSDHHSFIANGFVTHNCGLVKNMAMTCNISIDRNADDFFKVMKGEHEKYGSTIPTLNGDLEEINWEDYVYILNVEDPEYSDIENVTDYDELKIDDEHKYNDESEEDYKTRLYLIKEEEINKTYPYPVLINGIASGWCVGRELETVLHKCKMFGMVSWDSCIYYNEERMTLEIDTKGGRCIRPLLLVNNGKLAIDEIEGWDLLSDPNGLDMLLSNGCLMYCDSREQDKIMLAQSPDHVRNLNGQIEEIKEKIINSNEQKEIDNLSADLKEILDNPFTHSEVHPIAQYGNLAGMIPEANKTQGPRITYQASMGKQATNQYHVNHSIRFDTSFKMMVGPTPPIFQSEITEPNGLNVMPAGDTIIKCVYAHPDNPEDGVVVNRNTIKSGKFKIKKYTTLKLVFKKRSDNEKVDERIEKPPEQEFGNNRYHAIGEDGLPILGSKVVQGDCIIARMRVFREGENVGKTQNASLYIGIGEGGTIDRISITQSPKGIMLKVKVLQVRDQIAADKLASRYSQKGTIAKIVDPELLPRVSSGPNKGMVADFYVNPHAVPSRMPMGESDEMITSKAALYVGKSVDSTTFNKLNVQNSIDVLQDVWDKHLLKHPEDKNMGKRFKYGYEDMEVPIRVIPPGGKIGDGPKHLVPSGRYRKCRNPIYLGPCYIQTLRHHVLDKYQVRAEGTIDPKHHQPVGGRARAGGQRVGEMERDALISHGATAIIKERLMEVSDKFEVVICVECGHIAVANMKTGVITCGVCKTDSSSKDPTKRGEFGRITIPYVFKYLIHLLMFAMISVTFKAIPSSKFGTGKGLREDLYVT